MKRIFTIITLAITSATFSTAYSAETYTLDVNHTNVFWHANHLGFSTPSGRFLAAEGTITLDEKNPVASKIDVTINTKNVTGIEKFDTHLNGPDFFNTEKFPTATFVSDNVEVTGDNKAKVTGTLTLLGVSKPVTLDVTLNKIGEHPINKKKSAGFSATTTIKRSDFGMAYGIPAVSDDIKVTIESEASVQ